MSDETGSASGPTTESDSGTEWHFTPRRCGEVGKSGVPHLADYLSDDDVVFDQTPPKLRRLVVPIIVIILTSPFYLAFLFSFYSVCALIATFVATLLTAYALAPISAALEKDTTRFACALVSLFTSIPVVGIVGFVFVKMFGALLKSIKGFVMSLVADLLAQGREIDPTRAVEKLWSFIWWRIPVIFVGAVAFWLTCFVDGWVLVMGLIPFACVALVLLTGFIQAWIAFLALFISPFCCERCLLSLCEGTDDSSGSSGDLRLRPGWSDRCQSAFKRRIKNVKKKMGPKTNEDPDAWGLFPLSEVTVDPLTYLMLGLDYFWIGNFANHIWKSTNRSDEKRHVNLILIYVATALNLLVLVMDVRLQMENPLSFFFGAMFLRGILLPVLALFHPLTGLIFHTPEPILQWILRLGFALAVLVSIAVLIARAVIPGYLTTFRFSELPPLPMNWSTIPKEAAAIELCINRYDGLSVIELLGLAFGGYDIDRSPSVFRRQMEFFFGPNRTEQISYEIMELAPDIPLLIYNVSGTTVFAFRGFASGPELAVQVERLASLWVVPFILDELPMYGKMVDLWLSSPAAYAYLFGWHWFTPRSASNDLLQKAIAVYDGMELPVDSPVLFVGVNSGGTIAKRLAMLKGRRGISFLSLPIDLDEFDNRYNLEPTARQWVTSVINKDGLFSEDDPGFGANFALVGDPDIVGNDNVYESFCNLVETCGHNAQFGEYCKSAIGEDKLRKIKTYLDLGTSERKPGDGA